MWKREWGEQEEWKEVAPPIPYVANYFFIFVILYFFHIKTSNKTISKKAKS
jgi:hypothetical protein